MPANSEHRKHAKLARASLGEWGRAELALLGGPCSVIRALAEQIIQRLSPKWKIALIDADHHADATHELPGSLHFTDKIRFVRLDSAQTFTRFQKHALFNDCDAILVNGNHFVAKQQIVFIDPDKSLESRLERLTDVRLFLLKDRDTLIPDFLKTLTASVPVLALDETDRIISFFEKYFQEQIAPLKGLVLAGGKSLRMGSDKGLLSYHGIAQREYVSGLLGVFCEDVFLSCAAGQINDGAIPRIEDRFLGIGPLGGILSAMQQVPDAAWLTVACDMPFLSSDTLRYLVAHRNPSRLATAFKSPGEDFPEPLVTIWEPRSYPVLLQALSEGHSCPRKVLMASDIELLLAPDSAELQNVNDAAAYSQALSQLAHPHPNDNA